MCSPQDIRPQPGRDEAMISTGKWLELCEADAKHRDVTAQDAGVTFSARVSKGSLAAAEEITVCRLLNDRRTHNLVSRPNTASALASRQLRKIVVVPVYMCGI